jgi:hypothetical protein
MGSRGKRSFARRALDRDVPTVVLHIGDRDLHGGNIFLAAAEDATAWGDRCGLVVPIGDPIPDVVALPPPPSLTFVRLARTSPSVIAAGAARIRSRCLSAASARGRRPASAASSRKRS